MGGCPRPGRGRSLGRGAGGGAAAAARRNVTPRPRMDYVREMIVFAEHSRQLRTAESFRASPRREVVYTR